jgi:hypothetical protein
MSKSKSKSKSRLRGKKTGETKKQREKEVCGESTGNTIHKDSTESFKDRQMTSDMIDN